MKTIFILILATVLLTACEKEDAKPYTYPHLDVKVIPFGTGDFAFRIYMAQTTDFVDTAVSKVYKFRVGNVNDPLKNPSVLTLVDQSNYFVVGYRDRDSILKFVWFPGNQTNYLEIPSTIY